MVKQINYQQIWPIIKQEKLVFVIIILPLLLIIILYCLITPKLYMSSVTVNPIKLTDAGAMIVPASLVGPAGGLLQQKSDVEINIALIKTNELSKIIVKQFNLLEHYHVKNIDAASQVLLKSLQFVTDPKVGFLEIQVLDKSPDYSYKIANFYPIALGQRISEIGFMKASQRTQFLNVETQKALNQLNNIESKLAAFAKQNGILANSQLQTVAGISTQLQSQLVAVQVQLQAATHYATEANPEYQALKTQEQSIKLRLNALSGTSYNDSIPIPANLAPDLAAKYTSLMRSYTFYNEVYKLVKQQYELSKFDESSDQLPTNVQVIDRSNFPISPAFPRSKRLLILGFLTSLLVCVTFILIKNRRKLVR